MRRIRQAFTLIELLTVIAITAILLTIIVLPIFQSFNFTRAAQSFSDAQDKARILIEKIQREVNNGVGVRDNSGIKGTLLLPVPESPLVGNATILVSMPYTKMDIVRPAEGEPGLVPGQFTNPENGKIDPTLHSPRGQVQLPVSQGSTIVRYYIGLRSPTELYNNPYDGLLMARGGGRDNLFVMYRAEVPIYIWSNVLGKNVVNKAFFVDGDRDNDPTTRGPIVDDPSFFNPNVGFSYVTPDPDGSNDPTKLEMVQNWLKRSVIQTEISRYDMIQPIYNKANRQVKYFDLDGLPGEETPQLLPLVQFKPTRVSGEMAEGKMVVRLGDEMENAKESGPDVHVTEFGAWTATTIRAYPSGWDRTVAGRDDYLIARINAPDNHIAIFGYDPAVGGSDTTLGAEFFDITEYNRVLSAPQAGDIGAFNTAVLPAATASQGARDLFMAFLPDTGLGKIMGSFGIDTVQSTTLSTPLPGGATMNQPSVDTGPALTPLNDTNAGNPWASATTINERFNRIWVDPAYAGLKPDKLHRFIDLRVTPQLDGSISPMDPAGGFGRAKIVPGSEIVIGPDQNPGQNYGFPIRYTRTTRTPGPNQYKINYVDLNEPDYSLYGLPNPPATYTANNFESAVFQARFKVGYIQLNSDPNVPLPPGNIRVYYRFQFTGGKSAGSIANIAAGGAAQDAFAVDYDTRQLMQVLLTIRNYPQANLPNPQTVTLSATAKVRNYLR